MRRLAAANGLLVLLLVLHTIDHVSRGVDSTSAVALGVPALFTFAGAIVAFVLALRGSPAAAPVSVAAGLVNLVGFGLVHVAPHWSIFSEPYYTLDVNLLSWLLLAAPMATAGVVTALGLRALGRRRPPARLA